MSAIVSFSDGDSWSIGQRGWNKIFDRTCEKLDNRGLGRMSDEIYDYGVAFNLHPNQVRGPLAKALLEAALELQLELGAEEGWDAETRGPYFGDLVVKLKREVGLEFEDM